MSLPLTPTEAATLGRSYGLRTTPASLAVMRNRGGGPPFYKAGRYVLYRTNDLMDWIIARCSGLKDSTSSGGGRAFDLLCNGSDDSGDIDVFDTGHPYSDEVNRLQMKFESDLQDHIDNGGKKFDQWFRS